MRPSRGTYLISDSCRKQARRKSKYLGRHANDGVMAMTYRVEIINYCCWCTTLRSLLRVAFDCHHDKQPSCQEAIYFWTRSRDLIGGHRQHHFMARFDLCSNFVTIPATSIPRRRTFWYGWPHTFWTIESNEMHLDRQTGWNGAVAFGHFARGDMYDWLQCSTCQLSSLREYQFNPTTWLRRHKKWSSLGQLCRLYDQSKIYDMIAWVKQLALSFQLIEP